MDLSHSYATVFVKYASWTFSGGLPQVFLEMLSELKIFLNVVEIFWLSKTSSPIFSFIHYVLITTLLMCSVFAEHLARKLLGRQRYACL